MKKSLNRWIASSVLSAVAVSSGVPTCFAEDPAESGQERVVVIAGEGSDDDTQETKVPKLWLGILLKEIEGDLAKYLRTEKGILVDEVVPDSPAKTAGIEVGDILLKAGDQELSNAKDLFAVLESMSDQSEPSVVSFALLRTGKKIKVEVTPAARPQGGGVGVRVEGEADSGGNVYWNIAGDNLEDVKVMLEKLEAAGGGQKLNVFRLGSPSVVWTPDGEGETDDMDVVVKQEKNGEKMEVTVTRKDGKAAAITVIKGDEVQEFSEEDLKSMPEDVRVLVGPILKGNTHLRLMRPSVAVDGAAKGGAVESALGVVGNLHVGGASGDVMKLDGGAFKLQIAKMAKEMAEQSQISAEDLARHASEAAKVASAAARVRIEKVAEVPKEIEELKKELAALKAELQELRGALKDK